MNLEELQSVQSKERQATSLQNLRSSFYREAGEFIQQLVRERDRTAERSDDPFSSTEVRRLTDDIETARSTVEAIYERRVGKVVKMASIAAADMPTDDQGLTAEEAELFETLVAEIEANRDHVLSVLAGEGSDLSCGRDVDPDVLGDPEGEPSDEGTGAPDGTDTEVSPDVADDAEAPVDAADMMGGSEEGGGERQPTPDEESSNHDGGPTVVPPDEPPQALDERPPSEDGTDTGGGAEQDVDDRSADTGDLADAGGGGGGGESSGETADVERTTVQVLEDVGEIFGVDERTYELAADEVVTLPEANAAPLVEREAVERLD